MTAGGASDAVMEVLPLGIVVLGEGDEPVWMNAEARRCGAGDPRVVGAIAQALKARPAILSCRGESYSLVDAARIREGRIILLAPHALVDRLDPESAERRQLSADFHEIFRNSFDGIFVADGHGRTLMVNAGCERNYDLAADEMVGRHVSELEAAGFIRPVIATQVIATGKRITAVQRTHKAKTIMVTGIPIFDEAGRVRRVIINSRDTTELTQLQAELARAQDELARVESEVAHLRQDSLNLDGIVVQSEAMRRIAGLALRVAKVDATVLLTGESGVGKEVFARLIHKESPRVKGPFVKINCGAIPRELLESELFGYESGAFTGAQRAGKIGLIELAHRGTLFLDEIGELPLDMQVKLLHVLQDRTVTRVGATRPVAVDIRVIAATNRDLEDMVEAQGFRSDLFYRLNVVPIEIPPLRQRRDDILPLLRQSLATLNAQYGTSRRFSAALLVALVQHDWPGNVRELRNVVERVVVMAVDDTIGPGDLQIQPVRHGAGSSEGNDLESRVIGYERRLIEDALKRFGSTRAAARHLGISQSSVVRKLKRFGPRAAGSVP